MNYIGIDVGGSHVSSGLVDGHSIVAKTHMQVSDNSSLGALLPELEDTVRALLKGAANQNCHGVILSFCGIVDGLAGRIVETNGRYHDAPEIDFPEWARSRFGLPLRIENDARAALLGEHVAGAAQDFDDVVMVVLGTGVGGAAMIDGKLLCGKHSQAGCLLGHFGSAVPGRLCSCGNLGCIEAEASTAVLDSVSREHPNYSASSLRNLQRLTFKDLFSQADAGDSCARDIRERCIQVWAAATVSWIHAYDPELVVFGGGVMSAADAILPIIQSYVERHAWTPWGKVVVRKAALGNDASLFAGPALLAHAQ
jgi:glucokinase